MKAQEILDNEFLEVRAKLLQVAATFDRISRESGSVAEDPRMQKLQEALQVLQSDDKDRAEQIQLIFSRLYEDDWQENFFPAGLPKR